MKTSLQLPTSKPHGRVCFFLNWTKRLIDASKLLFGVSHGHDKAMASKREHVVITERVEIYVNYGCNQRQNHLFGTRITRNV